MSIPIGYSFSQYLFDRDWSVLINPVNQSGVDYYSNPLYNPDNVPSKALLFSKSSPSPNNTNASSNLKITFDIEKTSESFSNMGTLEIWNMNAVSRKSLQGGAQVTLSAGYSGLMKVIWVADILDIGVTIERRGPNVVTVLKGASSGRYLSQNIISQNFPAGTSLSTLISFFANALHVPVSTPINGIVDFNSNRPYTFCHSVKDAMDMVTIPNGLQWFIQDYNGKNELFVMPVGTPVSNQAIVLQSGLNAQGQQIQNTGLIGIPSFAVATGITKYNCFLNPDIFPGQLVQIVSQNVNGYFIVRKAKYKGDSHGNDWHIECESDTQIQNVEGVENAALGNNLSPVGTLS